MPVGSNVGIRLLKCEVLTICEEVFRFGSEAAFIGHVQIMTTFAPKRTSLRASR